MAGKQAFMLLLKICFIINLSSADISCSRVKIIVDLRFYLLIKGRRFGFGTSSKRLSQKVSIGMWLCQLTIMFSLLTPLQLSPGKQIVGTRIYIFSDTGALLEHGCPENWTFKNAFYFVGTVITTIGYGNVAPKTKYGKVRSTEFRPIDNFLFQDVLRDLRLVRCSILLLLDESHWKLST